MYRHIVMYWITFLFLFSKYALAQIERRIIVSDSFNPLYKGHLKLLEIATTFMTLL